MAGDGTAPLHMRKYIIQFAGAVVILAIAVFAFTLVSGIELKSTGIATLMGALTWLASCIVKGEGRELTKGERASFSNWTTVVSLALPVALVSIIAFATGNSPQAALGLEGISLSWLVGIFLFGAVLNWVISYFMLSWFVRHQLRALEKRKK